MEKDLCIFVCTHGRFGEELIKSAEMIAGKSENVYSFSLLPGMPPEEYKEMMEAALQKEAGKKVLCLVDLFGGTPCTTCAILSQRYDMQIIVQAFHILFPLYNTDCFLSRHLYLHLHLIHF